MRGHARPGNAPVAAQHLDQSEIEIAARELFDGIHKRGWSAVGGHGFGAAQIFTDAGGLEQPPVERKQGTCASVGRIEITPRRRGRVHGV